jgi:hypothetical protein
MKSLTCPHSLLFCFLRWMAACGKDMFEISKLWTVRRGSPKKYERESVNGTRWEQTVARILVSHLTVLSLCTASRVVSKSASIYIYIYIGKLDDIPRSTYS